MENDIIIKDINVNFSEYFKSKGISSDIQSKLNTTDILAVPTAYGDHEFYFAQETIDFLDGIVNKKGAK